MPVLLDDTFDAPLTTGPGYWGTTQPPAGDLNAPYAGDGYLHLVAPQSALNAYATNVGTDVGYPLKCTRWTWTLGDVPFADIYAGDFFGASFGVQGAAGIFTWQLRWDPATVAPPEPAGTDTEVVIYASWVTTFPPVADNDESSPVTFDLATFKYLRISEECRGLTWEYSADGVTWTEAFTTTLDPAFVYVNDWSMFSAMRAGYLPSYELTVDEMRGDVVDDCDCPGSGWYIGRVGSGGPF